MCPSEDSPRVEQFMIYVVQIAAGWEEGSVSSCELRAQAEAEKATNCLFAVKLL